MAHLRPGPFDVLAVVRERLAQNLNPKQWLSDEDLSVLLASVVTSGGCKLPDSVLIVPPISVNMIASAEPEDAKEVVEKLEPDGHPAEGGAAGIMCRSLVACPISDSSSAQADIGSHWTLLLGIQMGAKLGWKLLIFDSGRIASRTNKVGYGLGHISGGVVVVPFRT